jgi:hypothetical protein
MLMEQKNKGENMNQEFHASTLSAEEVLSQAITPEKKQELVERLTKLKSTLNQVEAKMAEQQQQDRGVAVEELNRRLDILEKISYDTRSNISAVLQIQLSEKYHPSLQNMIKNLERVNSAYSMILDGLVS